MPSIMPWTSPNGVSHAIDKRGKCFTCGRTHEHYRTPTGNRVLICDDGSGLLVSDRGVVWTSLDPTTVRHAIAHDFWILGRSEAA